MLYMRESARGRYPHILVEDARKAMALAAARFYGEPGKKLKVIGITGTNGKTTTAAMTARLINFCLVQRLE